MSLSRGQAAERLAEKYLRKQGLKLIQRNYRTKAGEIDLVMRQSGQLVFVEVRLRTHTGFGSGAESVTKRKQVRIIKAAEQFLQASNDDWQSCRFDVVSIGQDNVLDWIPDAFNLD